jgi:hypothetical protein
VGLAVGAGDLVGIEEGDWLGLGVGAGEVVGDELGARVGLRVGLGVIARIMLPMLRRKIVVCKLRVSATAEVTAKAAKMATKRVRKEMMVMVENGSGGVGGGFA